MLKLYVAADSSGLPVSSRGLSFRGARKHCKRLRRRVAGVHVMQVAVMSTDTPFAQQTLAEVAPGTYAFSRVTGGSEAIDGNQAQSEILRAIAILQVYTDGLDDTRADDRFVLWTVQSILRDACSLVEHNDLFLPEAQS